MIVVIGGVYRCDGYSSDEKITFCRTHVHAKADGNGKYTHTYTPAQWTMDKCYS
jgi:hypothetical protein